MFALGTAMIGGTHGRLDKIVEKSRWLDKIAIEFTEIGWIRLNCCDRNIGNSWRDWWITYSSIAYLWCLQLITYYAVPRPSRPTGAKLKVFCGPIGGAWGPSLGRGPMVKNHCPKQCFNNSSVLRTKLPWKSCSFHLDRQETVKSPKSRSQENLLLHQRRRYRSYRKTLLLLLWAKC